LAGFFPKLFLTVIHRYNYPQRKSSVPPRFVLALIWRDLQRDEVTRSCGEVNRLIERTFVEASAAVPEF
jgi:hypothetical protein